MGVALLGETAAMAEFRRWLTRGATVVQPLTPLASDEGWLDVVPQSWYLCMYLLDLALMNFTPGDLVLGGERDPVMATLHRLYRAHWQMHPQDYPAEDIDRKEFCMVFRGTQGNRRPETMLYYDSYRALFLRYLPAGIENPAIHIFSPLAPDSRLEDRFPTVHELVPDDWSLVGPWFPDATSDGQARMQLRSLFAQRQQMAGRVDLKWMEELSLGDPVPVVRMTRRDITDYAWWIPYRQQVDKFTYLRGLLKGEAFRLLEGYRVTEANYEDVVEVLSQRYGNTQAVVFAHIEALLSLPAASNEASSLLEMYTKLERHLRSLDSLKPGQDMILYSVILSKLPRLMKIEVHRQKAGQVQWSLPELRKWLGDEIQARDMGERLHRFNVGSQCNVKPPPKGNNVPQHWSNSAKRPGSASTLVAEGKDVRCGFCNASHYADNCTRYPDTNSRRAQLKDRCFICLGKGHLAKACRRRKPCRHCQKSSHHSSLCFSRFGKPKQNKDNTPFARTQDSDGDHDVAQSASVELKDKDLHVLLASDKRRAQAVMQTAVAPLESNSCKRKVTARLFFDTGASRSFITDAKRQELQLPVASKELLSVSSFQSSRRQTSEHKIVQFGVKCRDGRVQQVSAAVVTCITCPILKVPLQPDSLPVPQWSLAEPLIQQNNYVEIDVLIGMDYYYSFVHAGRVQGEDNLWFLSSKLGYLSAGRVSSSDDDNETVSVMLTKTQSCSGATDPPFADVSKYWELEEVGMKESQAHNSEDDEAVAAFAQTVKYEDGRYQVQWPWKIPVNELKDNYGLAYGRLRTLLGRLKQTPELAQQYAEVFHSQLDSGIIEQAPAHSTGHTVYYMPHHAVHKPGVSTTKLRIVFDASSKLGKGSSSLNECLHRGSVLLEDLCGLLLRFRMNAIALVSDIEKAFLQIGLQESQRDATRFLWVKNVQVPPIGDNLVAYRFRRVPFGVISSPFILAATVAHHLKQQHSALADKILQDIYVDNVITGEASTEAAIDHYRSAKKMFQVASMNLREWYTNSEAVSAQIALNDRGQGIGAKVLGLRWNTEDDTIRISPATAVEENVVVTKRRILKSLPQVFDPCGFLAPVLLAGKLLLQTVWQSGTDWDDPVPEEIAKLWRQSVLPNLYNVNTVTMSRYLGVTNCTRLELHVFCDASARACAAAVYVRQEREELPACTNLLMAKSRLAPIKQKLTIPRLELVAAVLGARLLQFVAKHLRRRIDGRYLWTDSQCVLCWLSHDSGLPRFVSNRIKELRQLSDVEFRYTPTAQNPADPPTRGCSVEVLTSTSLWWHGPVFLRDEGSSWPVFPAAHEPRVELPEPSETVTQATAEDTSLQVIDEARFSSFRRLLHVTAYVLRFVSNIKQPPLERTKSFLLLEEIDNALKWWIGRLQAEYFLKGGATLETWSKQSVKQLNIFRDDEGIIRCQGRLSLADVPYDTKYPIVLPAACHFTDLLIKYSHEAALHVGVSGTLARIRKRFWILRGRTAIKRAIRDCRVCRRYHGGSFTTPSVPELPRFRLEESAPFTNTGVDYLGPLLVSLGDGNTTKVWICLFTCAATRAVHLEVVEDMTADQFLQAFRRFAAMFGSPALVVSDNGKQFHAASRMFRYWWTEFYNSPDFRTSSFSQGIDWKFLTEMAPWMGGFYERLVGVVKQSLRKTLRNVRVSLSELRTVVAEVVSVVNSRPLTYLEDDVTSVPVSPAQLISPLKRETHPLLRPPHPEPDARQPVTVEQLTCRWRHLQGLVTNFWSSFRSQYLLSLRERRVSHRQRGTSTWTPTVGTVVHLKQDLSRCVWRLGRIQSLHPSANGLVRTASIRLPSGAVVRRPMKLIYPLEFDESSAAEVSNHQPSISTLRGPRTPRAAAVNARSNWQQTVAASSEEEE